MQDHSKNTQNFVAHNWHSLLSPPLVIENPLP